MKIRLDELLAEKKLFETRTKAQASIMAGLVLVNNKKIDKPGVKVDDDSEIRLLGDACPFVSRGGIKLEGALADFKVDPKGLIAADIGAGTGGFTDCLLKRGALKVYALDVGYGQMDWKLRNDPRVVVIERRNARDLKSGDLPEKIDVAVMDVSFISILKILPAIHNILKDGGIVVTLVKPQFEAERSEVPRGGVIRDKKVHDKVIDKIRSSAPELGFEVAGETSSPIAGKDGNKEFFLFLRKKAL